MPHQLQRVPLPLGHLPPQVHQLQRAELLHAVPLQPGLLAARPGAGLRQDPRLHRGRQLPGGRGDRGAGVERRRGVVLRGGAQGAAGEQVQEVHLHLLHPHLDVHPHLLGLLPAAPHLLPRPHLAPGHRVPLPGRHLHISNQGHSEL